jgi:solute carrier family 24 (sodium/potassium/calcium exchanger), member 6
MGLSENLAGVTLLAFGNGSPDLFTSLSNTRGDTELLYAQLMGAGVFLTGLVIGIVIIIARPFKLLAKNYLRDVVFYIVAAIVVHNFIHDQQYTLLEGFITIGIYIVYLTLVIVDHIRLKRKIRELRENSRRQSEESSASELLKMAEDLESIADIKFYSRKSTKILLEQEIFRVFNQKTSDGPNEHLLRTFYHDINPIDCDEWNEAKCGKRIFIILKVFTCDPCFFLLSNSHITVYRFL